MARKQRQEESTGDWMNTYADLVTLLLCFFVLLYSMSAIDAEKWQRFANAFKNIGSDTNQVVLNESSGDDVAPGGLVPNESSTAEDESSAGMFETEFPMDFDQLFEYLKRYTEEHNMEDSVELHKGENTIYIRFNNNIFFEPDKATLLSNSIPVLDFLGDCLASVQDEIYLININGHTASVDMENYPVSAWTLSGERATSLAIFFESDKGIDPKKLRPIGYGNNYPIAPNDTEEGRSQNRRVDMVIISDKAAAAADGTAFEEFAGLFDPDVFPKSGGTGDLLVPENSSEPFAESAGPSV